MPTPRDDTLHLPFPSVQQERSSHIACPPDTRAVEARRILGGPGGRHHNGRSDSVPQPTAPNAFHPLSDVNQGSHITMDELEQEQRTAAMNAVSRIQGGDHILASSPTPPVRHTPLASSIYEFSSVRQRPNHISSFFRAGSKFRGTQQSDKQIYKVEVDIKHVDMSESFLCGYLRIEGLTEDHPTLVTYFEGEIIGHKYTFQTKHESWGATDKTDMQHWHRFPAWRPLAKQAKKPDFHYKNWEQRENIFMRWKEYFLVPNHTVREIPGASFEGFYYICFNQVAGTVSGIYFHARSEKYQQLELTHVNDRGCYAAMEFR